MPSPLAHAGVTLLLRTWDSPSVLRGIGPDRQRCFWVAVLVAVWWPDIDILLKFISSSGAVDHGGFLHSGIVALFFGLLFATVLRDVLLIRMRYLSLFALGAGGTFSHLLLDMLTRGRGIMFLWPLSEIRVVSPIPLFYGVRHSQPWAFHLHLVTLVTELLFVGGLVLLARKLRPER